jgi:maleylacetate reductase
LLNQWSLRPHNRLGEKPLLQVWMNMDTSEPLTGVVQFVPTVERILYGASTVKDHLEAEVQRLNSQRVLLLAPRSFKGQSVFEQVTAILGKRLVASLASAFEHTPLEALSEAVEAARAGKVDLVVAIGGGSVIDAAKAVRICLGAELTSSRLLRFIHGTPRAADRDAYPANKHSDNTVRLRIHAELQRLRLRSRR